ncbi:NADH:flavin oxidoreductase [Alkalicoccobacillus murimartini]|uniref:2,4-dienoyl-CoA reductase-like NADH-dependent reductase (Old Yellow Enzyme family) n=1 Tax=Alkalicoccobacillus murimartini TaxID=171685 RepID=A0ABT9YLP6_9BACI|nr:NADH:flavin oxidoreductase [Alkalicoccobacillus murimartini]MDQ0208775.1 2,4-dienoyl-CoA reductase-like NADH-dependent reductase (Old Yellow Enzyme family) [Alkalicoccobacillus murimartini]
MSKIKDQEFLFHPVALGNVIVPTRIAMAPMTRAFSPNGVPDENVAAYYRRRAEHGVGLIITEGTAINHPSAVSHQDIPRFHGEDALAGWKHVVDEVHEAGGLIIPQIWHVGGARKIGELPNEKALPVSPSGLDLAGNKVTDPLTEEEIKQIIAAYAQAASDAKKVGFDGIELHGAHGYLIDQFLWEKTNKRTDKYGGDLVGRTTFAQEVIKACREAVGPDFLIVFRYSQWKLGDYGAKLAHNSEELKQLLAPLSEAGVDVFHASTRRFWEPEFAEESDSWNLAAWTKQVTGKPTITVGSLGLDHAFRDENGAANETSISENIEKLISKMQQDEFDLVAVGRALLADPEWASKLKDGELEKAVPYSQESTKTLS